MRSKINPLLISSAFDKSIRPQIRRMQNKNFLENTMAFNKCLQEKRNGLHEMYVRTFQIHKDCGKNIRSSCDSIQPESGLFPQHQTRHRTHIAHYFAGFAPYQRGVYTQLPPSRRGKMQVVDEPTSTMVRISTCSGVSSPRVMTRKV